MSTIRFQSGQEIWLNAFIVDYPENLEDTGLALAIPGAGVFPITKDHLTSLGRLAKEETLDNNSSIIRLLRIMLGKEE